MEKIPGIDRAYLREMLRCAGRYLRERCGLLSEIDSKFGDGDHGITVHKIAEAMERWADAWQTGTAAEFLDTLGAEIMGVNGGSAGPLWGTLFQGFGAGVLEEPIDGRGLLSMLEGGLEALGEITDAKVGDKTMMDALIPAVAAARPASGGGPLAVLEAAAEGARAGMEASKGFASKYGRAKSYGDQTIGTPDAGAVSMSYLFAGLLEGYRAHEKESNGKGAAL